MATNSATEDNSNGNGQLFSAMETLEAPPVPAPIPRSEPSGNSKITAKPTAAATASAKTLKRCLSVPIIHTLPGKSTMLGPNVTPSTMTTRSAAAAAAASKNLEQANETPTKYQHPLPDSSTSSNSIECFGKSIHIRSNPSSREVSPAPVFNIFAPRARRYSASSYSPLGAVTVAAANVPGAAPLCLTPRVSQLRQEECIDMNSREVNHEREVHSAMQMSQSWEDLTLVAENWSCKSDEFSNPLQVALPAAANSCSSPSPTSNRPALRLPYSPSPTRRTFATRRSMSPIAMRPSQLGPVKRRFELDDNNCSNWNICSPPPFKKMFTESRGSSPVYQSPSSVCPSPDSGTYDGRITPKLFISKLCTTNTNNGNSSACSSPMSASPSSTVCTGGIGGIIDSTAAATICSSSLSSSWSSTPSLLSAPTSTGCEPMCIGNSNNNSDEGISVTESEDKQSSCPSTCSSTSSPIATQQPMSTDIQDDATLMDDIKSETSSIGGCSSISLESSSCDSGAKTASNFFNRLVMDDTNNSSGAVVSPLCQKSFYINKQVSGAKKFIVNHENFPNSIANNANGSEQLEHTKVSSTTSSNGGGDGGDGPAVTVSGVKVVVEQKI